MATKFEQIIEHIINENDGKARALFHEIVVEKSRKIYEELGMDEEAGDEMEGVMHEVDVDDHNPEMVEADGEFEGDPEIGGDEADDLTADTFVDGDGEPGEDGMEGEFGDEAEGSEMDQEIEDRVVGLEDAFDELKAEFEQYINGEGEGEEEAGADDFEAGEDEEAEGEAEEDEGEAEEDEGEAEEDEGEAEEDEGEDEVAEDVVREYIEKVTDKAGTKEASGTNTKSVVAGKNDMGGTAKNLNQGSSEEKGRPTPKSQPLSNEKFQNAPGANAGVKSLKNAPKPDRTKEESGTNKKSVY